MPVRNPALEPVELNDGVVARSTVDRARHRLSAELTRCDTLGSMNLVLELESVPLRWDATGTLRVGNTRVTLDVLLRAYALGGDAEELVEQFPSLDLADVYSVLGYYLRHREQLEREYLLPRKEEAERLQQEWEASSETPELWARIRVRGAASGITPAGS